MSTITREALPEIPQPGRVVEVRGATWAVTDVQQQGLSRSPQDETFAGLQHVVTLQALGEDNLGDELRVVWELEVGHSLAPDQGLPGTINPDTFDDPDLLGAVVDAVRWGAVTSADDKAYQAPFRSGANVEPYQLEPLRRALQSPRTNLLLADDVGLGKTIEAGLVIQELLLRHRARSVVIVCPPSLSLKWQDEMRDKFGLDFEIVNSEAMAALRRSHGLNANPFRLFPRTIVSMAWLRSARAQRLLRDVYAEADDRRSARRFAFDVLVVDEAHHIAPASPTRPGEKGYAVDSLRTTYTRELAKRCEHRLFLSATPHNGHTESFTALLEMVDGRRFARGGSVDKEALKDVTVRRLKSDITSKNFKKREVKKLVVVTDDAEQQRFAELDDILKRSKKLNGREQGGDLIGMLLKKRLLSSPVAFGRTLAAYSRLGDDPTPDATLFDDDDEVLRETVGSSQSDEEEGFDEQPEFVAMQRRRGANPLSAATSQQIDQLISWGLSYEGRPDARLTALVSFLDAVCRPGKTWTNERVVVFTEYADTLHWIRDVLTSLGYGERLAVIEGATDVGERELIRQRFNADPAQQPVRVLLATDSAGEGIDLQSHCHRLVNFDIPFNPARLEQRIGRIDRYGQPETPEIYHFVPDSSASSYAADMDFLYRIAFKVATAVEDLGSMNAVIDHEIQQRYAHRPGRRAPKTSDSDLINNALAGDLTLNRQLTELANTFDEKQRDLHLTPQSTRRVVDKALTLSRQPPLEEDFDQDAGEIYTVPRLSPQWEKAVKGLTTRLDESVIRPITFDRDAVVNPHTGAQRADLVHVHLGHPLLQRSARLLRNAALRGDDLSGVTAVVVPDLDTTCVAAVSRLVLVGMGGLRLHEEVFVSGIRVGAQDLAEGKVLSLLDRALDPGDHIIVSEGVRAHIAELWGAENSRLRERLNTAVARRAESRQQQVAAALQTRRTADLERAENIFTSFRRVLQDSIRALEAEDDEMLPLSPDEREQRRRDVDAMRRRIDTLADEQQREVDAIRDRYTDVKPYVATVALVFAMTPADAEAWAVQA